MNSFDLRFTTISFIILFIKIKTELADELTHFGYSKIWKQRDIVILITFVKSHE